MRPLLIQHCEVYVECTTSRETHSEVLRLEYSRYHLTTLWKTAVILRQWKQIRKLH